MFVLLHSLPPNPKLEKMMRCVFIVLILINSALAKKSGQGYEPPPQKWQTLSGDRPLVIARGGFSGLFPESSQFAYQFALSTGLPDIALLCDLQLTKDGEGICQSDIRLDNSTNMAVIYPHEQKAYNVNGQNVRGWFAVDYTAKQLFKNVTLTQNVYSRPDLFDDSLPLSTVDDVIGLRPPKFWLNVQYDMFYTEHKQNVASFIQSLSRSAGINYISSPEIGFLKSMSGKINKARTKLIFRFLDGKAVEPTTKQAYSSLLEDLSSIKSFASGILVPKTFIWPVNANHYLEAPTSLVTGAHKQGLEVYVYNFANDMPGSYNYTYDPIAEYLKFIDSPDFCVDGLLTDFPPTASEAIGCFAQNNNTKPKQGKKLIITHNGASGVFPGCTDLAYQQAVDDGADIIDCSVQMTKDGVAFCLDSPDLMGDTTVMTSFMSRSTMVPEIQPNSGIFSFDLTWSEIQTLKPQMMSPMAETGLQRNPANKDKGKFITLSEFLDFAKEKAVSGVLINIENAAYLASKKGLRIVDAVSGALSNASFDKQSTQQVLIQSDDSSVLSKFKNVASYKKVLNIEEVISDAPKQPLDEIKKFADAVTLIRPSLVKTSGSFSTSFNDVVDKMHAANISVYVSVLKNEYVTIAFDFFSDPMVELETFLVALQVDGVVTEYPATASTFLRSPCAIENADVIYPILPPEPGSFLALVEPDALPPAEAPAPPLNMTEVVDPPLPPVVDVAAANATSPAGVPSATPQPSGQTAIVVNMGLCLLAIMVHSLLNLGY